MSERAQQILNDKTWITLLLEGLNAIATALHVDDNGTKARLAASGRAGAHAICELVFAVSQAGAEDEWPELLKNKV